MWYRIFGRSSEMPEQDLVVGFLHSQQVSVSGEFATDESGWFRADLLVEEVALQLERYLADEQGIRAELNSWAAWLETREDAPEHVGLMERMIQTAQLFTLQCGDTSARSDRVCVVLCRYLAETTAGVYQIDGRGFFAADGALLVAE
jgi:hypothetical protein